MLDKALFSEQYPHKTNAELAEIFGITVRKVRYLAQRIGLRKTEEFRRRHFFQKGYTPWHAGKKVGRFAGPNSGFNKGYTPSFTKKIGDVQMRSDGYLRVKVGRKEWQLLHRRNWEAANGPIPNGMVLTFIDGNRENCAVENLRLTTHRDVVLEHHIGRYPPELRRAIHAVGKLKRAINEKQND